MASVLVFGAGGPAGANFCRAAKMGGHYVIGTDINGFRLMGLTPDIVDKIETTTVGWDKSDTLLKWIDHIVKLYKIDVVHSQPEQGVQWLADHADDINANLFLPDRRTIALTQDKFETSWRWSAANLRPSPVVKLETPEDIGRAERVFGYPMWVRATRGAGARGATPAWNEDTVLTWIGYWRSREVDWEFIAEQYLPGRDFAWTSLWRDGTLIASQSRERLEYIFPHLAPSGRTGTPTHAVTVDDERIPEIGEQAVRAIDREAHGIFCVDMREDAEGGVWPTEINAGRFFTTSDFYAHAGFNFVSTYIHCAMGNWPIGPQIEPILPGRHWLRHIDIPSQLIIDEE
jgi:carbamoyl-phosphate synthase large subunit